MVPGRRAPGQRTQEDPLGLGTGKIHQGNQGEFLSHAAFLNRRSIGRVVESTATGKDIGPAVLEGELHFPLVNHVVEVEFHIILEAGTVTNIIQVLGCIGSVALTALHLSLSVGEVHLGDSHVVPGSGRSLGVHALVNTFEDLEAIEGTVRVIHIHIQLEEE